MLFADCQMRFSPSVAWTQTGAPDTWWVQMLGQPLYTPTLERPMSLAWRVQLIAGVLSCISREEPSNRSPYLR